ncbi:MAG: hypothetical protein L0221_16735, partial [Chloroflexi bacterium]|nr:hypothetical protein [Chloroflexota bacterium]
MRTPHEYDLDLSGLTPRQARWVRLGVHGGADDGDPGSGGDAPAEGGDAPAGDAPAEGEADANEPEANAAAVELPADLAIPEAIAEADEADLRSLHDRLEAGFAERREGAPSRQQAAELREIRSRQQTIHAELLRRRDEARQLAEELESVGHAEPLPEPVPSLASAADVA